MADRKRDRRRAPATLTASARPAPEPVVASAKALDSGVVAQMGSRLFTYEDWQDEAWRFFDSLGEFNYGVTWRANALSRVRLVAAEVVPGGDEPTPLTEGEAADLVGSLFDTAAGQASMMKAFGIHLGVPGDCFLLGEEIAEGIDEWSVKSKDEVRAARGKAVANARRQMGDQDRAPAQADGRPAPVYQVRVDDSAWRTLTNAMVVRIWEPNQRFSYKADSQARVALPIMREIDLYNRRIIAQLVSRLVMNGFLAIPEEITLPQREGYDNGVDAFIADLIEVASRAIQDPGTPAAAIPFPIRGAGAWIDKIKHIVIANGVDTDILDAREKAIRRLATTMHVPAEVILGMGDVNHWTSWQLEESAIKISIAPLAEVICGALTSQWLQPMLRAAGADPVGPNGGKLIVWYDVSELTNKPDRTETAIQLYDRLELSGAALRREAGFEENDRPTGADLKDQISRWAVRQVQLTPAVARQLAGLDIPLPAAGNFPAIELPPRPGPPGAPAPADRAPPPQGQREPAAVNGRANGRAPAPPRG